MTKDLSEILKKIDEGVAEPRQFYYRFFKHHFKDKDSKVDPQQQVYGQGSQITQMTGQTGQSGQSGQSGSGPSDEQRLSILELEPKTFAAGKKIEISQMTYEQKLQRAQQIKQLKKNQRREKMKQ